MVSGEARILRKIIGASGEIIYDEGGAVTVKLFDQSYMNYFFIGRHTTGLSGETYYITISVHESDQKLYVDGYATLTIRKGILGFGFKHKLVGEGSLMNIVEDLLRDNYLAKLISKTIYEEIKILKSNTPEVKGVSKRSAGEAIVIVGRTTILSTLRPYKTIRNMFLLNKILLDNIVRTIYQL